MTDAEVISDRARYAEVGRAYSQLEPAARLAAEWRRAQDDAAGAEELLEEIGEDAEMREELARARARIEELEEADPPRDGRARSERREERDRRNPGRRRRRGGGLWAGDLYRMLTRYAERRGFADRAAGDRRRQVHVRGQGIPPTRRRLLGVQVRGRHPPRPARSPDRVPGADPHLDRDRRGAARGRGRRRADRPQRPADRRLPLLRARAASRSTRPTRRCA